MFQVTGLKILGRVGTHIFLIVFFWNLNEVDSCDRNVYRFSVRSAMHAASMEKSPLMWMMAMMLLHLHVNLNDAAYDDEYRVFFFGPST